MKLEIISPVEALPVVKFNKEEIMKEISNRMQYYSNIEVTEETMKESKTDLANLRKFRDSFEEKRKELKKKFLKPYEDFEKEYKEIIELIDRPLNLINAQLQKLEFEQKETKKKGIKLYYEKEAKDIVELVPFERIFKDKWLNKTCTTKSIKDEIAEFVKSFKCGYETIKNLNQKYEKQIIDKFIQTFDLTVALAEGKRLEEQEEKIDVVEQSYGTYRKQEQERKNKVEHLNKLYGFQKEENTSTTQPQEPKKYVVTLQFTATCEQLKALKQFLIEQNIEFIKKGE